jgi:hypothetical protein
MAILPATVPWLTELTAALTPAQLRAAPPDEWSISDVFAHLRACQDVLGGYMLRIIREDRPAWRAMSPRTYMRKTDYPDWEFASALEAFARSRTDLIEVLGPLPHEAWQRTATVKVPPNKIFDYSVEYYGDWLAAHERTHLKQIRELAMSHQNASEIMPINEIHAYITEHFAKVDAISALGAWFYSADPDKHWPNFATIVTTDEHDGEQNSDLTRRGAFRLNIGIGPATFKRLIDPTTDHDYTATDVVIPHPTYAKQRWIGIVNPTRASFEETVKPLLDEAYAKVVRAAESD